MLRIGRCTRLGCGWSCSKRQNNSCACRPQAVCIQPQPLHASLVLLPLHWPWDGWLAHLLLHLQLPLLHFLQQLLGRLYALLVGLRDWLFRLGCRLVGVVVDRLIVGRFRIILVRRHFLLVGGGACAIAACCWSAGW